MLDLTFRCSPTLAAAIFRPYVDTLACMPFLSKNRPGTFKRPGAGVAIRAPKHPGELQQRTTPSTKRAEETCETITTRIWSSTSHREAGLSAFGNQAWCQATGSSPEVHTHKRRGQSRQAGKKPTTLVLAMQAKNAPIQSGVRIPLLYLEESI